MPFRPERDDWQVERSRMDWEGRVFRHDQGLERRRYAPVWPTSCSMCGRSLEAIPDCAICGDALDAQEAA